jgi:hypothetical protein
LHQQKVEFLYLNFSRHSKVPIRNAKIVSATQTSIKHKARNKMLNIHSVPLSTRTASTVDTNVLLRNLGRFPSPVLPFGLLCELQRRGDAIHDSLVALVRQSIDSVGDDLGWNPENAFFAFALLVPLATNDDQPLIESLLTLPEETIDCLIGDLLSEAMPRLVANFFIQQSASEVIDWIDRLADHPKLMSLNACALYRAMTIAVALGHLDRVTAIDALVNRLKKRADQRDDLQSALVVCELMDLSANNLEAVDDFVGECFRRNQIDADYVGIESWDEIGLHAGSRIDEANWSDPAAELSTWCYDFVSDELEPFNATFRANNQANGWSGIAESSVPALIDQLRHSTYEHFPRDAVKAIANSFAAAYHATVDLIREEMIRFNSDKDFWSGNGGYLGLVLTIVNGMPLPVDLLDSILEMPETDREQVFGDQFGLVVQAIGLTPLQQYDFVEQWIWDGARSDSDRREMTAAYLYAFHNRLMERDAVTNALLGGLQRALLEAPVLIAPYAENLAFLSPKEHVQVLDEAFKRSDVEWFLPLDCLRRMVRDSKFANDQFQEHCRRYRNAIQVISEGVMFNQDTLQEKSRKIPQTERDYQPTREVYNNTTIRNEVRTPRNAQCPCGSGKKYKKCCLNK